MSCPTRCRSRCRPGPAPHPRPASSRPHHHPTSSCRCQPATCRGQSAWTGHGVEAPHLLARRRIERHNRAPAAIIAACPRDNQQALDVQGGGGHAAATPRDRVLRHGVGPYAPPGLRRQRHDTAVQAPSGLRHEHQAHVGADRDTAGARHLFQALLPHNLSGLCVECVDVAVGCRHVHRAARHTGVIWRAVPLRPVVHAPPRVFTLVAVIRASVE